MFSTLTERGAATTLEALSLGATDYIAKPANVGSASLAQQRVREELIPKIKALCGRRSGPGAATAAARPHDTSAAGHPRLAAPARRPAGPPLRPEILAIGVSTGGPNALAELLPALPADFPVPVVIVQHMPPLFTRFLADRLDTKCHLRVVEAEPGMCVERGRMYIAPGDWHMTVERSGGSVVIRTSQGPLENSCRPAVDVLFRSCAALYGGRTLAVILTGMGQDGLRGCQVLHEAGAQILAQDEATSVVWGMPGFIAHEGLADRVLPLGQIAGEIVRRVTAPGPLRTHPATAGA
jgi:two-component system chemotaxis response regulator CheB